MQLTRSDHSNRPRIAVIGAGVFGRNHVRVLSKLAEVQLTAVVDLDLQRATEVAAGTQAQAARDWETVIDEIDAAVVATPTRTHATIALGLLGRGKHVLVEKPIADSVAQATAMAEAAEQCGCCLQVGHLERFNPAVAAVEQVLTSPLFFEVHRLSPFSPRSLDIDVVLDLMIHDLDLVLHFTGEQPVEIRAAGISVLSPKVDIANVRLAFPSGCIANLTASRVSTEQVRKLRLFQPREYLSLDYRRQDVLRISVGDAAQPDNPPDSTQTRFEQLPVTRGEPLERELRAFATALTGGKQTGVDAWQATKVLRLAEEVLGKIGEHTQIVARTVGAKRAAHRPA